MQRDRGDRGAESRDLLAATTDPGVRYLVKTFTTGGILGTGINAQNGADKVFSPILDVLTKLGNDLTLYNDKQGYASTFTPGNVVPALGPAVPGIGRMTARASGGPVGVGRMYPVNELGLELFAPSRPGTIIPANTSAAMAGAAAARGQGITWTGDLVINPTPGMDERALAKAAVAEMVRVISDTAARALMRGGVRRHRLPGSDRRAATGAARSSPRSVSDGEDLCASPGVKGTPWLNILVRTFTSVAQRVAA